MCLVMSDMVQTYDTQSIFFYVIMIHSGLAGRVLQPDPHHR